MAAKNGKPVRVVESLVAGGASWEVQEPVAGALLAVCPDCGKEFDADHQVQDESGRVGYECPWCLIGKFLEAREKAISDAVVEAVSIQYASLRAEVRRLTGEVEHLRPQNTLLRTEAVALRSAAKAAIECLNKPTRPRVNELAVMQALIGALSDEA